MFKAPKKRVLSGCSVSGSIHIGNYLDAIKGLIKLQEDGDYEVFCVIEDVYTITTPYDKDKQIIDRQNVLLDYLSVGLNPSKVLIFNQSEVAQLFEFSYYLSLIVNVARMLHFPTYRNKIKKIPQNATLALLNYPVFMASNILLFKINEVLFGMVQEPYLEVTKEFAEKMNDYYGTDFPEPRRFATGSGHIPSILEDRKMSKNVTGVFINLTDDLDTILDKLERSTTGSGKGSSIPRSGPVANLLQLVSIFEGEDKKKYYEEEYLSAGIKYNELKHDLASSIYLTLGSIQEKRRELESKKGYIESVTKEGAKKANIMANNTLTELKEKMGFI